jgi:Trm5-related predicted tRNA methylase
MEELRFGYVADFYTAAETLVDDASYDGRNALQDQTRASIRCIRQYFNDHQIAAVPEKREATIDSSVPSIDDFFS